MLVVEHVPCLECTFCGEQYFDALVLEKIENDFQAINNRQRQAQRIMRVAVKISRRCPLKIRSRRNNS